MQLGVRPAIASAWAGGEQVGYQLPGRWMVPVVFGTIGLLVGIGQWGYIGLDDWRVYVAVIVTLVVWVLIGWFIVFAIASWVFSIAIAFGVLHRAWEPVARWNARARSARDVADRAEREGAAQRLR